MGALSKSYFRNQKAIALQIVLFTPKLQLRHYVSAKPWVYQAMSLKKQNVAILNPETKGFKMAATAKPKTYISEVQFVYEIVIAPLRLLGYNYLYPEF